MQGWIFKNSTVNSQAWAVQTVLRYGTRPDSHDKTADKTQAKLNPKSLLAAAEITPPEEDPVLVGEEVPLFVGVGDPE